MKFCIAVCVLLVAVAYHEVSAYNAVASVSASCDIKDVEDMLGECVELHCKKNNDGKVHVVAMTCPPAICKDTHLIEIIQENLNNTYPNCCPSVKCA